MMVVLSAENRPLKRQKLGPPDVYPQDPKQKEDELDDISVKQGFIHRPQIQDEYGSALNASLNASKVAETFNLILRKKAEMNQLPDTGRKKQQINIKDNFWLVTPRTPRSKSAVEAWFKDLSGTKPLTALAKKVPIFPKREDMLLTLCEYSVPLQRAIWFIKMTFFYHESKVAESKIKKRQQPDVSQDMTLTLTRFLREQLNKLVEAYGATGVNSGNMTPGNSTPGSLSNPPGSTPPGGSSLTPIPPHSSPHQGIGSSGSSLPGTSGAQLSHILRNWNYTIQMTLFMYQDGLLDRQELLDWIVDNITRYRSPEQDSALKVMLPLGLQYLDEITHSEYLSRKLSYFSAVRITQMCVENGYIETEKKESVPVNGKSELNSNLSSVFQDLLSCNQHRPLLLALSSFIQAVMLDCSTALVYNHGGDKKIPWLCDSPLDQLPCCASQLPMPNRRDNAEMRAQLRQMEEHLKQRSRAAKNRWSLDKYGMNITGWTTQKVLAALNALDRHSFASVDQSNSLDTLYSKIFSREGTEGSNGKCSNSFMPPNINNNGSLHGGTWQETGDGWEDAVVTTVCQWAVTVQRCGEHRAFVAAKLLEKRQNALLSQSDNNVTSSTPYYAFQNLLLEFLDSQAPVFDDSKTSERSREFANLVLLFSELIRSDVFSHDGYMRTLISRGSLTDPPTQLTATPTETREPRIEGINIDDDLGKLIQNITKDAASDGGNDPSSPPPNLGGQFDLGQTSGGMDDSLNNSKSCNSSDSSSKHLIYAQHFPLPPEDSYSHEINQRYILLYGVGKARDEARHVVKKLTKEILKLFSKKLSNDIAEGGKVKKASKGEFSFDNLQTRFSQLCYFDQHVITNAVTSQVLEMLSGVNAQSSNYLPTLDHIAFLMDLMESAQDIHGLLNLCCQLTKESVELESVLAERGCLVGAYCPQLCLLVTGVLRKYTRCLLVSAEQTLGVFECLLRVVRNVNNPAECTSAERIIFSYLYSLYTSCYFVKSKHQDSFSTTASRIRQSLNMSHSPSTESGKHRRNPHIMEDYINNPKQRLDIGAVRGCLSEASNRYSFACSAVIAAVTASSNTRLNDIAMLCAEVTACCNALAADWLAILNVLCSSSASSSPSSVTPYVEVVSAIDLRDSSAASAAHASLSVFTAILIARDCFTFEELLNRVVIHSLKAAWNNGKGNPDVEPGARLSCHLLLRIFQSDDTSQPAQYSVGSPSTSGTTNVCTSQHSRNIRLSCDRHLLVAVHLSFSMEPVLAFIKAMLIVSDAMSGLNKTQNSSGSGSLSDILGTSYLGTQDTELNGSGVEKAPLSDFAKYSLRQICSQDWVREICLKHPEELCNNDNLLDSILTTSQAERVLHNICHADQSLPTPNTTQMSPSEQRTFIVNILKDLSEWRLRISWLDLHLMYEQIRGSATDMAQWLDNVAHSVIEVLISPSRKNDKRTRKQRLHSMNLIAPLISKLPRAVQGRVLKVSGQVLNAVNFGSYSSHKAPTPPQPGALPGTGLQPGGLGVTSGALGVSANSQSLGLGGNGLGLMSSDSTTSTTQIPVYSQKVFLQLMLMCLEAAQDDHLSDLLEHLRMQLMQPISLYRELGRNRGEVDPNKRKLMLEALRLRFGLIGGLFDVITMNCSNVIITEWAIVLVQLVVSGVIDLTCNSELFSTVLDMTTSLIHSTITADSVPNSEAREENKKHYYNLVKKIKKEVGECTNVSLRLVRQLIPLQKVQVEVVVMEPWGSITDTKGNRLQDFDKDKKHGVQGAEKQKLSPWDLLEGHRSPAPLSWAWLAATRLIRKTLKYQDTHQLLRFHTHSQQKSLSYFLEPPPLPQEDLEPEKQQHLPLVKDEVKAPDTPGSTDPNAVKRPGGAGAMVPGGGVGAGKNSASTRLKKRLPRAPANVSVPNQQTMPAMGAYQQQPYPGAPGVVPSSMNPQWGSNSFPHQPTNQHSQQQPPYYQPLPPAGATGPPRYQVYSASRNAIRQTVLERQHSMSGGMMGQTGPQGPAFGGSMGPMMGHQGSPMIRQQISGSIGARPPQQGAMYGPNNVMQGMRQGMPSQMYNPGATGGGQGPMGGQYGQYGPMGMGSAMGGQNYQQNSYQNSAMMGMRQPYINQGQIRAPQYMQTTSGGNNMAMMSGGQAYARPGAMASAGMNVNNAGAGGSSDGSGMMQQHHRMMMGGGAVTTSSSALPNQQGQQQMMMRQQSNPNTASQRQTMMGRGYNQQSF